MSIGHVLNSLASSQAGIDPMISVVDTDLDMIMVLAAAGTF
jgi:hypothetical protein